MACLAWCLTALCAHSTCYCLACSLSVSLDSKAPSSQGIRARSLAAQGFAGAALVFVWIGLVPGKTEGPDSEILDVGNP